MRIKALPSFKSIDCNQILIEDIKNLPTSAASQEDDISILFYAIPYQRIPTVNIFYREILR